MYFNSNPRIWNENLCDSQMLTGRGNSQFNPTVKSVCGVGNSYNRVLKMDRFWGSWAKCDTIYTTLLSVKINHLRGKLTPTPHLMWHVMHFLLKNGILWMQSEGLLHNAYNSQVCWPLDVLVMRKYWGNCLIIVSPAFIMYKISYFIKLRSMPLSLNQHDCIRKLA